MSDAFAPSRGTRSRHQRVVLQTAIRPRRARRKPSTAISQCANAHKVQQQVVRRRNAKCLYRAVARADSLACHRNNLPVGDGSRPLAHHARQWAKGKPNAASTGGHARALRFEAARRRPIRALVRTHRQGSRQHAIVVDSKGPIEAYLRAGMLGATSAQSHLDEHASRGEPRKKRATSVWISSKEQHEL